MKWEIGQQLDIWLGNGGKLDRWEGNSVTASDRCVLVTKWVATAVDNTNNKAGYRRSDDGGRDRRRAYHPRGVEGALPFMDDGSENEGEGGGEEKEVEGGAEEK